jgi:hypothetical protein
MKLPNLLLRRRGLSLLCAGLLASHGLAQAAGADTPAAGFTPKASLDGLFELEGKPPYSTPYDGTLSFSALDSKFATAHGHGYRNELKIATKNRRTIEQTREHFSAIVTPTLPNGAKTIVSQYHVDGLDTILKVYVQDTDDKEALDGKAGNGVFDIVAKILGTAGHDVGTAVGTIRSGESFALDIQFDKGVATVSATTAANGKRQTEATRIKGDQRKIYFKFGDYFQAQDPATGALTWEPAKWDAYFRQNHMERDQVRFSQVSFVRD